jgi:hypothetical protein
MYNFFPDNYWWTIRVNGIINESYLGGGSYGEIIQVVERLDTKEPESWVREWEAMGDKVRALALEAEEQGILILWRDRYLRAANYYQLGALSLKHNDPNMVKIYEKSVDCFQRGIRATRNIEIVKVPYENSNLPGYFVNASREGERRPVVVIVGGTGCRF